MEAISTTPTIARLLELRNSFYISLAITAAVYIYLLTNFPIGNHDWSVMKGIGTTSQLRLGRWFSIAVFSITSFKQLPVANVLLALTALVASGMSTCLFIETCMKKNINNSIYIFAALICSLIPFANWSLYYTFVAAHGPTSQLLCIIGLIVTIKNQNIKGIICGGIIIMLSMATYQSSINTAATLFWAAVILLLLSKPQEDTLKSIIKPIISLAISITLGAVLYKLSLSILEYFNFLNTNAYHFKYLSLSELPERIIEVFRASFKHFSMPHPYFAKSLKILLIILSLTGMATVFHSTIKKSPSKNISLTHSFILLASILLMIFSTKIQFLMAAEGKYYINRFAAFGVSYFYITFIVITMVLLGNKLKKIYSITCILCIAGFIIYDLEWQNGYVQQNKYDTRFINKIIARIEGLDGFRYSKSYDFIQLGLLRNIRKDLYTYEGHESYYHNFNMLSMWAPEQAYQGLEPYLKLKPNLKLDKPTTDPKVQKRIDTAIAYVKKSKVWPHKSSVAIVDGTIIVILAKSRWFDKLYEDWKENQPASAN